MLSVVYATATFPHEGARASQPESPTTVRGVVFDSLNNVPLAGATVWIDGSIETATSDELGRFLLNTVEPGKRFIAFSSPTLDSIGIGTLSKAISVDADGNTVVSLSVPSFAGLWRTLCADARSVSADSGIMWGTVRDAETDVRYNGARAVIQWAEPQANTKKQLVMTPMTRVARTDSTGTYVACGLPVQTNMFVGADGPQSASGTLRRAIGASRIARIDFLVSSEMELPRPVGNAATTAVVKTAAKPRGTSVLHGVVRDDHQRPLGKVTVNSSAADTTVLTNENGEFILGGLPAGTHSVEARQIGASVSSVLVDLRPGVTSDVALVLRPVTSLANFNVTAKAGSSRDREDFESRRKFGFGYALTEKDFAEQYDIGSALRHLPNLTVSRASGYVSISPPPSSMGACNVKVWIDGMQSTMYDVNMLQPYELKAVEWYPSASAAPIAYNGSACAVIMFWTDRSRWAGTTAEKPKKPES